MSDNPLFIGFATLEQWAETVDHSRPVLAISLVEPGPNTGGLQTDELVVYCQQPTAEGCVLYCRMRAASLTRCYDQPFDSDWQDREAAWKSLWAAVEEYLLEGGFTIQRATVARPKNYVFLEGRAEGIRFDPETRRYRRSRD